MYNEKYLKTDTKPYQGKMNTSFYDAGMLKVLIAFVYQMLIASVFEMGKNYYPQLF